MNQTKLPPKHYSKTELFELLDYLEQKLQGKEGAYLVQISTALEDLDIQNTENIIAYFKILKNIFGQLADSAVLKFDFKIAPFTEELFEIQEKFKDEKTKINQHQ